MVHHITKEEYYLCLTIIGITEPIVGKMDIDSNLEELIAVYNATLAKIVLDNNTNINIVEKLITDKVIMYKHLNMKLA